MSVHDNVRKEYGKIALELYGESGNCTGNSVLEKEKNITGYKKKEPDGASWEKPPRLRFLFLFIAMSARADLFTADKRCMKLYERKISRERFLSFLHNPVSRGRYL